MLYIYVTLIRKRRVKYFLFFCVLKKTATLKINVFYVFLKPIYNKNCYRFVNKKDITRIYVLFVINTRYNPLSINIFLKSH